MGFSEQKQCAADMTNLKESRVDEKEGWAFCYFLKVDCIDFHRNLHIDTTSFFRDVTCPAPISDTDVGQIMAAFE